MQIQAGASGRGKRFFRALGGMVLGMPTTAVGRRDYAEFKGMVAEAGRDRIR